MQCMKGYGNDSAEGELAYTIKSDIVFCHYLYLLLSLFITARSLCLSQSGPYDGL